MKRITNANGYYYIEQKIDNVWAVIAFLGDEEDYNRLRDILEME